MVKLIIDTDPGIDDAMAIFHAAASPDIELVGLTTIFGNVTVETATRNALRLVEAAGLNIPVAQGAVQPLVLPLIKPSAHVHGKEGFGDIPAERPKGQQVDETAAEFLIRMAREHAGNLVLCPIGPLTNIAQAIQMDPDFVRNVSRIVIMGGGIKGGNITEFAEANIYHDPHAAEVLFASGARVEMIGLDVTHEILCTADDFEALAMAAPDLGGMLKEMSIFYLHFYETVGKFDGCSLHDPAAVIACERPDWFGYDKVAVRVVCDGAEIGRTVVAPDSDRPVVKVAMRVDADSVKNHFMTMISHLN